MLHNLLFVHGFWSYQRMSKLVNFIFYKASLLAITGFFFGFFSGFSGQQFYNDPPFQLYNVIFTALPIIIVAVFDKPLPRDTLQNNPVVYREAKGTFNPAAFWGWILRSVLHSAIMFFIPQAILGMNNVMDPMGRTHGHWTVSTVVFLAVALVPTFLVILEMSTISLLHILSILSSISSLFLFTFLLSKVQSYNPELYGDGSYAWSKPAVWLTLILVVMIPLVLEIAYRGLVRDLRPTFVNILQERLRKKRLARDKSIADQRKDGQEISMNAKSASQVVVEDHDEKKWGDLKKAASPKASGHHPNQHSKLDVLNRHVRQSEAVDKKGALKSAMIQSMLRFRNLTGSQFTSAAQAKFAEHDTYVPAGKNEGKQPEKKPISEGQITISAKAM
jgi:hypothetical protein